MTFVPERSDVAKSPWQQKTRMSAWKLKLF